MQRDQRRVRITLRDARYEVQPRGLLAKVLTFASGAVALAIVSVVIVIGVGYVWWKTRDLRRHLRENPPGGRVIDGDAFRDQD